MSKVLLHIPFNETAIENVVTARLYTGNVMSAMIHAAVGGNAPISGNAGPDALTGSAGNDTLNGDGGDDTLIGGGGNDLMNGGVGLDTAIYSDASAGYTVSGSAANAVVIDNVGTEGIDTMTSVERLRFTDGVIALDVAKGGHGGDIYRLYQAAFNREPDPSGIGFWIAQSDKGTSLDTIAAGFMDSPEFRAAYGTAPSNTELVTKIYENVLHRAPDAEGLNWYVGLLDSKTVSAATVLVDISQSDENYAGTIAKISNGFFFAPFA